MAILSKKSEMLGSAAARSASGDIKRKAYSSVDDTKEGILEIANEAGQKVRDVLSHYSDDINHTKEVLEDNIRNKPLQAGLIAIAAGVLLGFLIRR